MATRTLGKIKRKGKWRREEVRMEVGRMKERRWGKEAEGRRWGGLENTTMDRLEIAFCFAT